MNNLIQYCIDKGLNKFIRFKFERRSKVVMREHFISNTDVSKYNLYLYVHKDKYGRYKLSKYVFKKISYICEILKIDPTIKFDKKISEIDENIFKSNLIQRKLKLEKLK